MQGKEELSPAMDPLRKLVSGRLAARPVGPHPDADALSAFAENALPSGERSLVMAHLADCSDCRQTLFLSLPQSPEVQKVLALKPSLSSRLAFRWGTLAAAIVIVAGVLTARHEFFHARSQSAKTSGSPVASYYGAKVAEEKVPPELSKLRDDQANKPEVATPPAVRVRPAEKRMTAKLEANLDFDKSGQVRLSEQPRDEADKKTDRAIQNLPLEGRNAAGLKDLIALSPGAAAQAAPAPVAQQAASQYGYIGSVSGAVGGTLTKQTAANSFLGGVVQDPSGAVVANAKVTTVGPVGTRTVTSDPNGRFAFDQLTPGAYSLRADANGFQSLEIKRVPVFPDKPSNLEVTLAPGAMAETVEVSSAAVPVETDSARALDAEAMRRQKTDSHLSREKASQANSARAWDAGAGAAVGTKAKGLLPLPRWTLSPTGEVQSSDDGGRTWQTVSVTPGTTFRALSALGRDIWVGGAAGMLYHSADLGQHWTRVTLAANGQSVQADITHVDFSDYQHGTIGTSKGEVWSTEDGGATWQRK